MGPINLTVRIMWWKETRSKVSYFKNSKSKLLRINETADWHKISILSIIGSIIVFLNFSLINYLYCNNFEYSYPYIEISSIINGTVAIPTTYSMISRNLTYEFKNDLLLSTLREIYSRQEEFYFKKRNKIKIIVQPDLFILANSISLQLTEGYRDFELNRTVYLPISVNTVITRQYKNISSIETLVPKYASNYFSSQKFFGRFINPLLPAAKRAQSTHSFDFMVRLLFARRLGNLVIFLSFAVALFGTILFYVIRSHNKKSLFSSIIITIVPGIAIIGFSISNLISAVFIDLKFSNIKNHIIILLYLIQLTVYSFIFWILLINFGVEERKRKDRELILNLTPSPEMCASLAGSSCYSDSSTNTQSIISLRSSEEASRVAECLNGRSVRKQSIKVHYSGLIQKPLPQNIFAT